jgi:Xaa-Pro aminopeptidase
MESIMVPEEIDYREYQTPGPEVARRISALQERIRTSGMTGLIVMHPVDLFYFSGTSQNGTLWIPAEGEAVLYIVRNLERARAESPLAEIHPRQELKALEDRVPVGMESVIGLEMDVLPMKEFNRVQDLLPGRTFQDATPLIQDVRQIKSAWEAACMRDAGERHARVFREIPRWIREGSTELELSAFLERALRLEGHQGLVRVRRWNLDLFYGPVVSGPSACHPSGFDGPVGARGLYPAVPQGGGWRKLRRGEPVLIDLVFGYNGYFVDKARTFFLGPPSDEYMEAYDLCRRIQEAIVSRLRPGNRCDTVYQEIMHSFEGASPYWEHFMGCGENRVRFLGHGVGLELDEWPVLAPGFREPLQAGMTLAVEPKIFLPGRAGIGVENTFLVTDGTPEKLTDFPDDPVVVEI